MLFENVFSSVYFGLKIWGGGRIWGVEFGFAEIWGIENFRLFAAILPSKIFRRFAATFSSKNTINKDLERVIRRRRRKNLHFERALSKKSSIWRILNQTKSGRIVTSGG